MAGLLMLAGCTTPVGSDGEGVGYCPTMEPYAREIAAEEDMELLLYGSAAAVLHALRQGQITVGVIGRIAAASEYPEKGQRLAQGYTLIGPSHSLISYETVKSLPISTALAEDVVAKRFPELEHVAFHESTAEALKTGSAVLIDWDEWQDGYQLLVPVHPDGRKVSKFRTPVVYRSRY